MRKQFFSFLLFLFALSAVFTNAAEAAQWKLYLDFPWPDDSGLISKNNGPCLAGAPLPGYQVPSYITYSCSYAKARVRVDGESVSGDGIAHDHQITKDVGVVAVASGVHVTAWVHYGDGVGEVEVSVSVNIRGTANLKEADCKAAAVGSIEFDSDVTGKIAATITKSAGATFSVPVGSVGGGSHGVGGSIPIVWSQGALEYPDSDKNATFNYACPKSYFSMTRKSNGYIQVWANGNFLTFSEASCTAEVKGGMSYWVALLTHKQCPY
ncbi:MAG: hypothetical protein ACKVS6_05445 [Planctomycetota bacterium]